MKKLKFIFVFLLLTIFVSLENCGPVIISSRPSHPTPPWFYPNRVVNVRYIYFPEYTFYYDLSLRTYIYLDNGIWISANMLPSRYRTLNLRHARQVRINDYYGDNIRDYHPNNRSVIRGRRN